jgi:hypothetical protein
MTSRPGLATDKIAGFEVLTAVSTKMAGCLLGCSAVQSGRNLPTFQRSETLVNFYQTTRCYNAEGSHRLKELNFPDSRSNIHFLNKLYPCA